MKKTLFALLAILLALLVFTSCSPDYRFRAAYPEEYTAFYFYSNYVQADPNLIHLYAAKNDAGRYKRDAQYWRYYAIKDVPIDEYVCYSEDFIILDPGFSSCIARNKNMEMTDSEILSYEVSSAELYWHDGSYYRYEDSNDAHKMEAIGEHIYYETVASIDATAFQNSLRACVEAENYIPNQGGLNRTYITKPCVNHEDINSELVLKIRVHFAEYENIVWDGVIVTLNGVEDVYYVNYQLTTGLENASMGHYYNVYVPLDEAVAKLIPSTN